MEEELVTALFFALAISLPARTRSVSLTYKTWTRGAVSDSFCVPMKLHEAFSDGGIGVCSSGVSVLEVRTRSSVNFWA